MEQDLSVSLISSDVTSSRSLVDSPSMSRLQLKSPWMGCGGENHASWRTTVFSWGVMAIDPSGRLRMGEKCLRFPLYQLLSLHRLCCVTVPAASIAPRRLARLMVRLSWLLIV